MYEKTTNHKNYDNRGICTDGNIGDEYCGYS